MEGVSEWRRDPARCPWPHKEAHATRESATTAITYWRSRRGDPNRVYECPCGAYHSGREPKKFDSVTIYEAPRDAEPASLTWERTHCTWCWFPVVRGRLVEDVEDRDAFCTPQHQQLYRGWMATRPRLVVLQCRCGASYETDANPMNARHYCSQACKSLAKAERKQRRKKAHYAAVMIEESFADRQDPQRIMRALNYFAGIGQLPWPTAWLRTTDGLPDGRIEVDAFSMPARILVGTGPMHYLDHAARDGVWIVWDGLAGQRGLRAVADWAGVKEPARLIVCSEWILSKLEDCL